MRFLSAWYYTRPEAGTLTKRVDMNWCSFLGHEYSFFNATVHLNALKTLKNQNNLGLCPPESPAGLSRRFKAAKTIALQTLFPL